MQYLISFLEGVITFVSPCLLPMLPIYISYFAGGTDESGDNVNSAKKNRRVIKNALGFILGFTVVFVLLGALAGTFGRLLNEHQVAVNIITGLIVIFFGLNFLGVFKISLFKGTRLAKTDNLGFFSSVLFGVVFSVGWTPCVGAFLGSALMLAASQGKVLQGVGMLLLYSLGLGIPFFVSAVLIDKLKGAFSFIKRHYRVINIASGAFLVIIGVLMATGLFGRFLALLS
ncbi:MAG TPA: cytochrome c biogenesis protein CcdA [Firmicutes bacterium]|nr:cytochrome c biogenesis protein CcdA [Bacillota bacterium]